MSVQRVTTARVLVLALLFLITAPRIAAHAQQAPAFSIHEHYNKQEVMIPMRDGTKLFTSIYSPKDTSHPYPFIMQRTPYSCSPYGASAYPGNLMSGHLAEDGFIFVFQDVRGRWHSEGTFEDVRPVLPEKHGPKDFDETTDTYDTIDWLVKNVANNNGRVGMWGISYPAFYVWMGALSRHPALKAVSPQAPVSEWYLGDDIHHNGAFFLADTFGFFPFFELSGTSKPNMANPFATGSPDPYDFFLQMGSLKNANDKYLHGSIGFWNDLMQHGNYDKFWQDRSVPPRLANLSTAVLVVGGEFDAEDMYGALHTFKNADKLNSGGHIMLAYGPWVHGGWSRGDGASLGDIDFDSATSTHFRETIEQPFFDYYLKDKGTPNLPKASVFETGSNQWLSLDAWPPTNVQRREIYFHAGGALSFSKDEVPGDSHPDSYVSDPAKPVPYIGAMATGGRHINEYMDSDQRYAGRRTDVLVYETPPLESDVSIAGPVDANLVVSTTGTDSDFIVKLIDVRPDHGNSDDRKLGGYQQLVRGDVMRGKFRNSFEKPQPFIPGKPTHVDFSLPDVCHTFKKGHRIMVQIQSTWFPLVDRNPQKFVDIYNAADSDFQKATISVYHDGHNASHLTVGVLP
jgi:putative CocE/NonD family hydrolase